MAHPSSPVKTVWTGKSKRHGTGSRRHRKLGKPGAAFTDQLLCTADSGRRKFQEILHQHAKIGICGIVLKLGRLISDIPPYIMDYCNYYHIPLITVPKTTQYETMIPVHHGALNAADAAQAIHHAAL